MFADADAYSFGQIYDHLKAHRILRTKVPQGERFVGDEMSLAETYTTSSETSRLQFERFLAGSGFQLIHYDSFAYPGIPQGADYYIMIRDKETKVPSWIDQGQALDSVRATAKSNNSVAVLRIWFFFIWLNMLNLIYSKNSRPLTAIINYDKCDFTFERLAQQMEEFIEGEVRSKEPGDEIDAFLHEVLMQDSKSSLKKRVRGLLKFLVSIRYLSEEALEGQTIYSQTLIMAAEIANNTSEGLRMLDPQYFEDQNEIYGHLKSELFIQKDPEDN